MKLKKAEFQVEYRKDDTRESARMPWPCLMVPGSTYCIAKTMQNFGGEKPSKHWAVYHIPSGQKTGDFSLRKGQARDLLELIEAAKIGHFQVIGTVPDGSPEFRRLHEIVKAFRKTI